MINITKVKKYKNNEILDSIIEKTISKNSIDAENVVSKNSIDAKKVEPKRGISSIFSSLFKSNKKISKNMILKNNIQKNMILKNEIQKKYIKFINPALTLELQPYLSNNILFYEGMKIDMGGRKSCGGLGCVYLNIKSKNENPINNIIFKTITYNEEEFKSLIFHYLLQKYYENNNKNKLKYLCNLYEFGTIYSSIDKKTLYYAIMENCGMDLSKYFEKRMKRNEKISVKDRFIYLLTIFKECCNAVKIMHDLEYLHLDIKPQNFVITNNGQIKIIDFGESQKVGYQTKDLIGTSDYIANDWMENFSLNKETILQYHHDIFSLGCMFVELLFKYVLHKKFNMVCPLQKLSKKENISIIRRERQEYDSGEHNKMLKLMEDDKINGNIIILIDRMVNPDPKERYQKIDDVIKQINSIIKELKKIT